MLSINIEKLKNAKLTYYSVAIDCEYALHIQQKSLPLTWSIIIRKRYLSNYFQQKKGEITFWRRKGQNIQYLGKLFWN